MRVFKNADFISCEESNRVFRYLVEDCGRIVFTGDQLPESHLPLESVDLQGRCVVPAFADTHMHFTSFAYFNAGLDCRSVRNFDEMGNLVRQYVEENRRQKLILGFGCSAHTVEEQRLPHRVDLDGMTGHPFMLIKYDGHAAVGNSALIAKLPKAILSDSGFNPETGWFHLDAFYRAVNYITKSLSLPALFRNMIKAGDHLARRGIATVHSAEGVGFPLDLDVDILRFANRGLPQQFTVFFQTMNVRKVLRRKMTRIGGCFANALDGCLGSEDAALREPYSHNTDSRGTLFYRQEEVNDFVREANRKGLQVALHAIGDAAVDQALAAFANALEDFPRTDHRHIIIHADLMDRETIEKAARLAICIALQPPFLDWPQEPQGYLEKILGNRIQQLIPLKSMLTEGLVIAGGSDAPCTLPDPMASIHSACNHPNSDESVAVLDALRMHTAAAAWLTFDEERRGALKTGAIADFVVLSGNPLVTPREKLNQLRVEDLYLKGERYGGSGERGSVSFLIDCLRNSWPDER